MSKEFSKKGKPFREPKEFEEEVIEISRVTRVVKGGRRLRFRATVVIGNRNQKVGFGVGKSNEVTGAIQKAVTQAKKNIIFVPLTQNTIPHPINIKFKSAKILLLPASEGTGIIAGGPVRKILELAGIKNVLSKIIGTKNRLSNTHATINALKELVLVPGQVAQQPNKNGPRGKNMNRPNQSNQSNRPSKKQPQKDENKKVEKKTDNKPQKESKPKK